MAENLQHEDFGVKIGGAKKDLWKDRGLYVDDLGAMNEREAEKFVKKDNVWKKPDYQAMLDDGVPLGVVYFIKKARDSLGASPQYRYSDKTPELRRARQEEYIETVRQLQAVIEDVRTLDDAMQAYDRFLIQNGYVEQVQGWASGTHYRATKKSLDNPVITNKLVQALHIRSASHFDRDFTQKAQQEQFGVSKDQKMPKGYAIHFNDGKNTYSRNNDWKPGTYYVTKGYSILQTNLESREAALKWVQDFARQRSKGGKVRFTPPQLAHVRRTGPDYRSGQEITGQHYLDTFGFRGGEFGNWMNQNDRQASLNMGFEALKDLAAALQISDQDIAFGGTLAIAFGARGSGTAAAHYAPLRKVINLTQLLHDKLTDDLAGTLAFERAEQLLLDVIDDLFQLHQRNRAFLARLHQTIEQLLLVVRLPRAIALDQHKRHALHRLVGGEALGAGKALAAAADAAALLRRAGVDDLAFLVTAVGAFHGLAPHFLWFGYTFNFIVAQSFAKW